MLMILTLQFQSFSNHDELQKEMVKRTPHKIDIGAVFNARPSDHRKITNFQPVEKELVTTRLSLDSGLSTNTLLESPSYHL